MTYFIPIRVHASRILRVERQTMNQGVLHTDDREDPEFRYSAGWGLDNDPAEGDWLVWSDKFRQNPIVIKKADWRGDPT